MEFILTFKAYDKFINLKYVYSPIFLEVEKCVE